MKYILNNIIVHSKLVAEKDEAERVNRDISIKAKDAVVMCTALKLELVKKDEEISLLKEQMPRVGCLV